MQEIFKSLIYLADYCAQHNCAPGQCDLFARGCVLQQKIPRFWHCPDTVKQGMHALDLQPVKESEPVETIRENKERIVEDA